MKLPQVRECKEKFGDWVRGGYVPEPISAWEWLLMRVGFACLLMWEFRDWHAYDYAGQRTPKGLARFVDLTWLHEKGWFETWFAPFARTLDGWLRNFDWQLGLGSHGRFDSMLVLGTVLCVLYVLGIGLRWVLPLLALESTIIWTYFNSQGFQHHGHQLVTLVLWVQTVVVWSHVLFGRQVGGWWQRSVSAGSLRDWLWFYTRGIVLFSYTVSGLTKVISSRGLWLWNAKYLCAELVKSHRLSYYKELDPALAGDPVAATWLLHHPFVAQAMFGIGFFIEVFAWLGLRDQRWSALMGAAIIIMHFNIAWLMRLNFDNHVALCAIFLLNVPGWIALGCCRLAKPQAAL
jgi:hypothetical protein